MAPLTSRIIICRGLEIRRVRRGRRGITIRRRIDITSPKIQSKQKMRILSTYALATAKTTVART